MKCENCKYNDCPCRNEGESNKCPFESHVIQMPDEWANVRIQAAISAMQAIVANDNLYKLVVSNSEYMSYTAVAQKSVKMANALVKELRKAHE